MGAARRASVESGGASPPEASGASASVASGAAPAGTPWLAGSSSSAAVQGWEREAVSSRMAATSAAVIGSAVLPQLVRSCVVTAAISSSDNMAQAGMLPL